MTGRAEAYYSDYRGTPQEFISAMKWGYLYQGQWYSWQKKTRGTPALDLAPTWTAAVLVVTGSQRRIWWLVAGLTVLAAIAVWWFVRQHGT